MSSLFEHRKCKDVLEIPSGTGVKVKSIMTSSPWPQVWPINTHHLILSNFHSESDAQSHKHFTIKSQLLNTLQ